MLLAIDIGNTNTVLGLFHENGERVADWRLTTHRAQTVDEYGVLLRNLFALRGLDASSVDAIIISSVVPPMDSTVRAWGLTRNPASRKAASAALWLSSSGSPAASPASSPRNRK